MSIISRLVLLPSFRRIAVLAAFFVALSAWASTSITNAPHLGQPLQLTNWLLQPGDDPRWAASDYNDSAWKSVSAIKPWDQQGFGDIRGYFWLRNTVRVPPDSGPLALSFNQIGPYEIFVDGHRIGTLGEFPPKGLLYSDTPKSYAIPWPHGQTITIALRFWVWPNLNIIYGFPGTVYIGPAHIIKLERELAVREAVDSNIASFILIVLYWVITAGLLVLFLLQRNQTEYIWLSLAIFFAVFKGCWELCALFESIDNRPYSYISAAAAALSAICVLQFVFRFLRESTPWWVRLIQCGLALSVPRLFAVFHSWIPLGTSNLLNFLFFVPYWFITPALVFWRYRRGNKEAGLLAVPLFLLFLIDMLEALRWLLWRLNIRTSTDAFIPNFHAGLVPVSPDIVTHFLFFISIATLILYRFQKTRAQQVRAQAELEAARNMQEIMVPTSASAEGYRIESAYIPAQEVGGDFFQLFPGDDGSLLVVIGDVSGKGIKAAMLVSLILGLLLRTIKVTREPARVLGDVNELLIGHTDDKFATCCCALVHRDGRMLIANAGHLSPYCNGAEIDLPGGVPLGIAPEMEYEQIQVQIPPGQRVLFLSDGVVEARSKSGELYGFERTRGISIEPASRVAETAQQFGQEDDITVLGIQPEPVFV